MLSKPLVSVKPDDPAVSTLLNSLGGIKLSQVMATRKELLVVPHYQLMTFDQLQQVGHAYIDWI